jgi:uncharacterized protein YutE (UPF0331/DUF86 family)
VVDRDLILAKAGSVKRHLNRVDEKSNADLETFLNDIDRQEIILFNLQMAIQNCIDIAAHIISDEGLGVPGSTGEMFYLLEENKYLDHIIQKKWFGRSASETLLCMNTEKLISNRYLKSPKRILKTLTNI